MPKQKEGTYRLPSKGEIMRQHCRNRAAWSDNLQCFGQAGTSSSSWGPVSTVAFYIRHYRAHCLDRGPFGQRRLFFNFNFSILFLPFLLFHSTFNETEIKITAVACSNLALNVSNNVLYVIVCVQESERLEMVNSELKAQIEELRLERQQLMVMLNLHRPTCIVRTDSVKTPESEANPLLEQLGVDTN